MTNDVFEAISNLSSNNFWVVALGTVLGCSIKEVIPPAAAALLSVAMVALCVNPGSLKWTWSSIKPGIKYFP